ncbi:hypothetical protein IWW37_002711 [Coemansia sp. RSA 2050]|nr:hypothetical protein IWW37_002711 [Coemansia sp. RSA 2050]KAJ2736299.1 hypothetical protein IW152_000859 [Coemansia sp. BCRC 34962]
MEYEPYYTSLWDRVQRPNESEQSYDGINAKLLQFSAAIGSSNNAKGISQEQWIDSLAVAASYAVSGFEWASPETRTLADRWIAEILLHLGLGASDKLTPEIFQAMCTNRVKPYFGSRSGASQSSQQSYVLMNSGVGGTKSLFSDTDRWRKRPQCIATFTWALRRIEDKDIAGSISLILPVILALAEDYDIQAKIWGLRTAQILLDIGDAEFLRKSGIAGVMEKSTRDCLVFRSEPGFGAELLRRGFECAIRLARIMYLQRDDARYTTHWWMLTEKVVANSMYVSDNIAANAALCEQIAPMCEALGPAIARYLRPLIGVLARNLQSPIYLSPLICQLHLVAMKQLEALILACPQRTLLYSAEVIGALAISWSGTLHKQSSGMSDIAQAQELALSVLRQLIQTAPEDVCTAVTRLHGARPDTFAKWKEMLPAIA